MSAFRIGSLFSGYGGLEQGVQTVLGGTVAWHSEVDPGACKILAHRHPDVPNIGDITTVDWTGVERVDVITGGSPCQDLSQAGKRAGMTEGTRSNLWVAMREVIAQLRPPLVVWENVQGALSAPATSDMELREGRLGAGDSGPVLRALGRVLGDLADLGYDASWQGLRAVDVGAPHGRFRVFVAAWDARHPHGMARASTVAQHRRPEEVDESRAVAGTVGSDRAPAASDAHRRGLARLEAVDGPESPLLRGHADGLGMEARGVDWGPYSAAVQRWERRLGRRAPAPTEVGQNGQPRLSCAFVEFLMGLPAGWVTDVPGLTRNEQLKALGNGVVPQQAAQALRLLLPDVARAAA